MPENEQPQAERKNEIEELRILPPFAIGRLGSSNEPMDNYTVTVPNPVGYRQILPAKTFAISPETGEITHADVPQDARFRDKDNRIRPVAPFLEVWARRAGEESLYPLTLHDLRDLGVGAEAVAWHVHVGNIKAFRRTGDKSDMITAQTEWFSAHDVQPMTGLCDNFLPEKTLLLGSARYIRPNEEFPQIRLRFTPAGGYVYGPEAETGETNPRLKVIYDAIRGKWRGWIDQGLRITIPGDIYAGEDTQDGFKSLGYLDDECDGIVQARLTYASAADGAARSLTAYARIAVGPPTFAPDSFPIRTVADELEQAQFGPTLEDDEEVTPEEVEEIVRRALESARLMNTEFLNRSGMARMDSLDFNRAREPIMDTAVVDNLAMRARHERVLLALESGTYAWFARILRRYDEIGDLSDNGRRKMPAMMRGADGRNLALTRRQLHKVEALAQALATAPHGAPLMLAELFPELASKTNPKSRP